MDVLLREFLSEAAESLDIVDAELVRFERRPQDGRILGNVFRLVHTIKGTCGFLGLNRLEVLAHATETLLAEYRAGLPVTPEGVASILATFDRIKGILEALAREGVEPDGRDDDLIAGLQRLAEAEADARAPVPPASLDPAAACPASARNANDGPRPAVGTGGAGGPLSGTVRVSVETLEKLTLLVGELAATQHQLRAAAGRLDAASLRAPVERLAAVTDDLRRGVMTARMQPIETAWRTLPRMVRALGRELGKGIELRTRGGATELDREAVDLIKDALVHMVRNCADHGLEDVVTRRTHGKPDAGLIRLRARREGGEIAVTIEDDGRGLDVERIKATACALGLVGTAELAMLDERQVQALIFEPGFSTAAAVTSVSGRGVGLDVVRANIVQIGGSIEVRSRKGRGTAFTVRIPLTLAAPGDGPADRRLLLVDDDALFRDMLTPYLDATGYRVTSVATAEAALHVLSEGGPFDAIVTDTMLPAMDGFAFAALLAADARWRGVPVIALSSRIDASVIERGRRAGFADIVGKFDRQGLLNAVRDGGAARNAAATVARPREGAAADRDRAGQAA